MNYSLGIFDLDYSSHIDILYLSARRYCHPCYTITYLTSSKNFYLDSDRNWVKINGGVDCFAFVILVLKDLGRMGLIQFPFYRVKGVIEILRQSELDCTLQQIHSSDAIEVNQCGVFFYTKNLEGWSTIGERHMGFYFRFEDGFRLIHNSIYYGDLGRVREISFDSSQMDEYINKAFAFYIY